MGNMKLKMVESGRAPELIVFAKKYISVYYFLLPMHGRVGVVFGSNFRNGDFDGFTRFEVP